MRTLDLLEIVLVNDGSRDRSSQICKELCNEYPGIIKYLELSRNFGEHNALMAGLNYVKGEYCILMDDDMQNPPEEVFRLREEIDKGYDVVYTYYKDRQDPFFRRLGSSINDIAAKVVLNKPADLYLSSFKIIDRFIINEIIKYDGQDPYIDGIIMRSTDRVGTVAVSHNARRHGQSGYTLKKLVALWLSMALNFSLIPLRIIGFMGLLLSSTSIIYTTNRLFFDNPVGSLTDQQSIMSIVLALFGLLILCVALQSEYIGKIYLSMNKQPQYIVREHYSLDKPTG
jgi:undecaprenyl-phosphate 4-deoxy-4-formamido-L-arabinose transferase